MSFAETRRNLLLCLLQGNVDKHSLSGEYIYNLRKTVSDTLFKCLLNVAA